jgi:hypothetical protein
LFDGKIFVTENFVLLQQRDCLSKNGRLIFNVTISSQSSAGVVCVQSIDFFERVVRSYVRLFRKLGIDFAQKGVVCGIES